MLSVYEFLMGGAAFYDALAEFGRTVAASHFGTRDQVAELSGKTRRFLLRSFQLPDGDCQRSEKACRAYAVMRQKEIARADNRTQHDFLVKSRREFERLADLLSVDPRPRR